MSRNEIIRINDLSPLVFSVTRILMISTGKARKRCVLGSATGFFYKKDEERYLITNRHVVIDEDEEFYPDTLEIRLHTSTGIVSTANMDISIPLYNIRDGTRLWREHPDEREIDIVAIPLNSLFSSHLVYYIPFWWSSDSFIADKELLNLGLQTKILGYPMGFYDEVNNLPIIKSGNLASAYGIDFEGDPFFLIDANLNVGNSGSPVILTAGSTKWAENEHYLETLRHPRLLGIYSDEHIGDDGRLGLHTVWYAKLIEEIISTQT